MPASALVDGMRSKPHGRPVDLRGQAVASAERMGVGFRNGTPEAVQSVYRRIRRIVAFRGFGIPRADREEIEQETMKQLWEAVAEPSFALGPGFGGFVDQLAARRCIDWYRRCRSSSESLDRQVEAREPDPLARVLSRERIELASEALASLDTPCRRLLDLRVGAGLSFREISRRLGRSPGALRIQMYRCVRRVRERVGRYSPRHTEGRGAL